MRPLISTSQLHAVLLLMASFLLGCRTPSSAPPSDSSFFPLGIYDVPQTDLANINAAGFNLVVTSATAEYLNAAHRHGLKVLSHSSPFQILTNTAAADRLRRLDPHPALWAWYTIDEPDLHGIPPPTVGRIHKKFDRLATKPTMLVLMSGSATINYREYPDMVGLDFYPVPWAPISQFAKEMKLARFALGDKPYFAILQAFDWSAFPELLETNETLRPPTYEELRCMTYMALAHRAKGLFFYTYKARDWDLSATTLWPDVKSIVREVNELRPLFTATFCWWSPNFDYLEGPDAMYNEAREAKIILVLLEVKKGNAAVSAGRYALAVNTTSNSVPFRLELPHAAPTVPVLGSQSPLPLTNNMLYKDFSPFEVICLGPLSLTEKR